MDPNATLEEIDRFVREKESNDELYFLLDDLYDWLKKGGFEPDWEKYPDGTVFYRCKKEA